MTIVNHATGEITETISADEARRLTTEAQNEFKSSADHFDRGWDLVREAVVGGGHIALGYRSPGDYVHAEFDGVLQGLDIAQRRIAVRELGVLGLSTRAIAPALSISPRTAAYDAARVQPCTPQASQDAPPRATGSQVESDVPAETTQAEGAEPAASSTEAPEESAAIAPAVLPPVVGIDGKTYPRREQARPRPVAETYLNHIESLADKAAREAQNLTPDQIRRIRPKADLWTVGLRKSIEVLQDLVNSLDPEENK